MLPREQSARVYKNRTAKAGFLSGFYLILKPIFLKLKEHFAKNTI